MYGKISNGCCTIYNRQVSGSKPIVETTPEKRDGYYAVFRWIDAGEAITQEWIYKKYDTPPEPTAEDKAEAYDILMGVET